MATFGGLISSGPTSNGGGGGGSVEADNGLSVNSVTSQVELGQVPDLATGDAMLLSDRIIPMNAFSIKLNAGSNGNFLRLLDAGGGNIIYDGEFFDYAGNDHYLAAGINHKESGLLYIGCFNDLINAASFGKAGSTFSGNFPPDGCFWFHGGQGGMRIAQGEDVAFVGLSIGDDTTDVLRLIAGPTIMIDPAGHFVLTSLEALQVVGLQKLSTLGSPTGGGSLGVGWDMTSDQLIVKTKDGFFTPGTTATTFSIPHGLPFTPNKAFLQAMNATGVGAWVVSIDSVNINISFAAPAVSPVLAWQAVSI